MDCHSSSVTLRILRPANRLTRLRHAALWLAMEPLFSFRYSRLLQPLNTCSTVMSDTGPIPRGVRRL